MNTFTPPNILLVDDVNANLMVLTEMIHNAGYIARPVSSARQAANAIEALTPNLILMDISMPEIDGFIFCSMLKKSANTRDIPVIFISAMNTPEDKIKGYESGAVDFITKPFDAEEVLLRIGIHLRMYKMQQELEAYNKKLNKIINEQIGRIYEEQKNLIYALVKIYSKKDSSLESRLESLGKNSRLLAMSLQLSPKFQNQITNSFVDAIEITSQLLDIGKIAIHDSISEKTSQLSAEETVIMKTHSMIGALLLKDIYSLNKNNELLKMAIDIARYHHENWDGSGYPQGLCGAEIPLSARIVAVTDAYCSLTFREVNRISNTHERSMELINAGIGILYDPDIIKVFNLIQKQLIQ